MRARSRRRSRSSRRRSAHRCVAPRRRARGRTGTRSRRAPGRCRAPPRSAGHRGLRRAGSSRPRPPRAASSPRRRGAAGRCRRRARSSRPRPRRAARAAARGAARFSSSSRAVCSAERTSRSTVSTRNRSICVSGVRARVRRRRPRRWRRCRGRPFSSSSPATRMTSSRAGSPCTRRVISATTRSRSSALASAVAARSRSSAIPASAATACRSVSSSGVNARFSVGGRQHEHADDALLGDHRDPRAAARADRGREAARHERRACDVEHGDRRRVEHRARDPGRLLAQVDSHRLPPLRRLGVTLARRRRPPRRRSR